MTTPREGLTVEERPDYKRGFRAGIEVARQLLDKHLRLLDAVGPQAESPPASEPDPRFYPPCENDGPPVRLSDDGLPAAPDDVLSPSDRLRWEAVDASSASSSSACHEVHDDEGNIVALCFQQEDAEHIAALHNAAVAHAPAKET